ncbi:Protocadherin alpha-8 [Takifugu flavidus]|uniref:Protocadherin alpha-8 n=1 Tax=Takifugu flavidus TaxID=433684 RepID=A0A5C6MLM4_9TELE|nr:Protocadherin alpha-8 [Takifugu flavidus]
MEQRRRGAPKLWRCWVAFTAVLDILLIGASAQIRYSISEEVQDKTIVGNIAKDLGLDQSSLKERSYRIVTGATEPLFQVNQNDGILYVNKRIDREEVCDRISPCLINLKTVLENPLEIHYVAVEILDINDHSPVFPEKEKKLEISESALPGARFQLQAGRDPDVGQLSVQQYKLSHNEYFRLDVRDRGEDRKVPFLVLQKQLDRETASSHKLQLTALDGGKPAKSDSGSPSLSSNVTVNVFILDQNDNAPVILYPVSSNGSAEGVEEIPRNVNAGHLVTKVRAYDADIGYNGWLLFSLQQVSDHSLFGLDRYTGQIRTLRSFTETDEAEHKLVILVKDNGNVSLSATATVMVKLVEPKEAFAASDLQSSAKDDEDSHMTFYLIITLGSVSVLFIISIIVLIAMQCSKSPDYTSKYLPETNYDGTLCHSIQYRSGDKRYMYSISEEVNEGTAVGNVAKDLGLDKITLKERKCRIVSSSADVLFQVNQNDGVLYVSRKIDREEVCAQSSSCLVNLKTVLENPLEIHYVEVEVLDINDHSPIFPEDNKILEISESVLPGARFQLKGAQDADSGRFSVQHYKLSQNDHFRLEVKDRGKDDSGSPSLSSNVTVNVFILDQNDNAPVILYPVSSNGSAEGVEEIPRNVNAGHLQVSDHSLFGLDRYTGQIRTLRSFTETDEADHKLVILVKDNGNSSAKDDEDSHVTFYLMITLGSVSVLFIISIIVLIAMQCSKSPDYTSKYLPETNYDGTLCHSIQYRSGDKRYMLVGPRMSIGSTIVPGSHANTLVLPDRRRNNEEEKPCKRVPRNWEPDRKPWMARGYSLGCLIVVVLLSAASAQIRYSISEEVNEGTAVGNVAKDLGLDKITLKERKCRIVSSNADVLFQVNQNDGVLYVSRKIDREEVCAQSSSCLVNLKTVLENPLEIHYVEVEFQVVASDSGSPSLSSNVTVNVFILDQNDNAPVILYPVSSNGSAEGVEEIPRNVNAGHLVTKVRAYDADIGYNGWLLFSLQQVSDHSLFGLDRYTGQIRTLRSFTETDEAEHKLAILVKDNGNVSLSATATVMVKLVEPKEAFAASDLQSSVKDNEDSHVTFYLIITLGSVSVLFIISIIVLIAMQCSKSPDYTSKYLPETNYDGTLCHSIQYRSGDKRYMLVGPRMSIGSTIVPGSHANTLVLPDRRRNNEEVLED